MSICIDTHDDNNFSIGYANGDIRIHNIMNPFDLSTKNGT
jgi:hypothetical protein